MTTHSDRLDTGDIVPADVGYRGANILPDGTLDTRTNDRNAFAAELLKLQKSFTALKEIHSKPKPPTSPYTTPSGYIATRMKEFQAALKPDPSGQNRYSPHFLYHPPSRTDEAQSLFIWFSDYVGHIASKYSLFAQENLGSIPPNTLKQIKNLATTIPSRFNEIGLLRQTALILRENETDPAIIADYDTMLDRIGDIRARVSAIWGMSVNYISINAKPEGHKSSFAPPKPCLKLEDGEIKSMMQGQFLFVDDMLVRLTQLMESEPIKPLLDEERAKKLAEYAQGKGLSEIPKYVPEPLTGWDGLRDFVKQKFLQCEADFSRRTVDLGNTATKINHSINGIVAQDASVTVPNDTTAETSRYHYDDLKKFDAKSRELYTLLESFEKQEGVSTETIEACKTARKELRMMNRTMHSIEKFTDMVIARTEAPPLPLRG